MERTSASGKKMVTAERKEMLGQWILLKASMPDGSLDSMDYWRRYFGCGTSNIFELIDRAIQVAAVDFPNEFSSRKVQIAESLFSTGRSQCSVCEEERVQLQDNGEQERMDKAVSPSTERKMKLNITNANRFNMESQGFAFTEPTMKEAAIVNKQLQKRKNPEELPLETMLNLAKKKMLEVYDQAKQAKRQRTVQIIELQDLPKEEVKKPTANPAKKGGLQRCGATSKTPAKPRFFHHL